MGYIYKILNDINDKLYIGKTEMGLEKRFKEHCRDSLKRRCEKRPLYSAMRKYGVEHFFIEKIEECASSELADRECFWIGYYGTFGNGYNATSGGDGTPRFDAVEIVQRLFEHPYPIDVAKEFGCSVSTVSKIASANNVQTKNKTFEHAASRRKSVLQFTLDGTFIRSFSSYSEAADWCFEHGCSKSAKRCSKVHIAQCARGERKSAYGYIWKMPV